MDEETEEYEDHGDGKSSISADLIRGHINTIILRSLYDKDKYGYEIMNDINEKSHGQYTLKQPTLYSALKRLENQGYIQAYWKTDEVSSGGRRKYFRLTETGKEITEKNQAEWEYSRTVIDNLISDKNFDFSQPAPTPVDFRLLRKSTSRVPTGGNGSSTDDVDDQQESDPQPIVQVLQEPVIEAVTFTSTHETSVLLEPEDVISEDLQQEENDEVITEQPQDETTDVVSEEQLTDEIIITDEVVTEDIATEQPSDEIIAEPAVDKQPTDEVIAEPVVDEQPTDEAITEPVTEEPPVQQAATDPQITVAPLNTDSVIPADQPIPSEQPTNQFAQLPQGEPLPAYNAGDAADLAALEDQRRISHEILEKLMAGEFEKTEPAPESEQNTSNVPEEPTFNIYATRPETERDYRNLVDKIFEQTLRQPAAPQPVFEQPAPSAATNPVPPPQVDIRQSYQQPPVQIYEQVIQRQQPSNAFNFNDKASNDGLRIQTSDKSKSSDKATRSTYNRGATLFTCSLIVGGIILLEFILCLILKDTLAISFAYPFVILSFGLVDILVCGILFGAGYGKQVRKPTSLGYIFTSILITALIILIIVIFAIILNVNWSVTTDVLTKVVIPCIVSLNIPIFTLSFYLLTK